ncbi:hypothetical protein HX004_17605 [Myroides sp. 1354]|uniref:hypothetical protein n=1 Tax=unclassified Myroides TaxID=2642485 RepID=UPI00257815E4|nr:MULTISPECIES: hypothetical protein [unclassified Myroides]MDM1046623.1 hypothetical protein [Myroides sp. R163-1]MDM1057563.1 hypothetical protein [Myroides sp. 1354]MDM1070852.1 hypothetical protein [Myroides sp. 1372]
MEKDKIALDKAKQVLNDFKRDNFLSDSFKVFNPEEVKKITVFNFSQNIWKVVVSVPQEQFGGTGLFSIYIKDETMEPFMFHDGGAEGRVPFLNILSKNGKYVIGEEWKEKIDNN